ncbi:MAG: mechanosensitive ion channel family protein [Saprospiraceae bacterium]|nr:mechanosensitive ion channel family protein [Saprospiraceae bacterium]
MDENLITYGLSIAIILITVIVATLVNWFFRRMIRRSTETMNTDPTNYQFLRHASVAIIYILGFAIAINKIPDLKALSNSLLAGAGILTVAVGFASQHALSNIISGVFIVLFKPFRVTDRLKIREYYGIVEDITLRHTVIRDFENRRILIPNAVISDEVLVNADFGEESICRFVEIGISYDSNVDLAREIMVEEVKNHPFHIDVRTPEDVENGKPEVPCRVISLGDSSVNMRAWAWARDSVEGFQMHCELLESIKKRFDREGVSIPFPHRTLVYKDQNPQL